MKTLNQIQPWKIINSKIIHQTPWIKVIEDECEIENSLTKYTYTRRVNEGPLIIAEENNKLWMVRQYRHPIKKIIWQFPVEGKLKSETWKESAQRGIVEEIGLKADKIIDLGVFYPDPGGLDQKYHAYLAKNLSPVENQIQHKSESDDEFEDLEKKAFSLDEIDALIDSGEICDNWTLSGLYLYFRYRYKLTPPTSQYDN